jgi:hypothetical protein
VTGDIQSQLKPLWSRSFIGEDRLMRSMAGRAGGRCLSLWIAELNDKVPLQINWVFANWWAVLEREYLALKRVLRLEVSISELISLNSCY